MAKRNKKQVKKAREAARHLMESVVKAGIVPAHIADEVNITVAGGSPTIKYKDIKQAGDELEQKFKEVKRKLSKKI